MCAGVEPGCCLCTAHTHRAQKDHEETPRAHLNPRRFHQNLSSPGALVKSCFSLLASGMGTFATGEQEHQGHHCWALPSAEPPTRACVCLWHLLGDEASLPCLLLSACTLPHSHMALLLCKAELCLLRAWGSAPGPGAMGQDCPWAPLGTPSPGRGAGGLMEQDRSMFSFLTLPSTRSWQLGQGAANGRVFI